MEACHKRKRNNTKVVFWQRLSATQALVFSDAKSRMCQGQNHHPFQARFNIGAGMCNDIDMSLWFREI